MIKWTLTLLFLTLLTGCQQTTVLLYARYLPENEKTEIVAKLKEAEFDVETNDFSFPKGVRNSTIIGSPLLPDAKDLDRVAVILDTQNWPIYDIRSLTSQNHWFTKDTIGVFLVPTGIDPHEGNNTNDIANRYQARRCENTMVLELDVSGDFSIEAKHAKQDEQHFLNGKWRVRGNQYIEMLYNYPSNEAFFFEISHYMEQDQISHIKMVALVPLQKYPVLATCKFEFGTRELSS